MINSLTKIPLLVNVLKTHLKMFRLILLMCLVASISAQSTQVAQCTNHPGEQPINTHIDGCSTPPCDLPQLQDAVINIIFRAPRNMRVMRTLATAYLSIGIITLPIPYDLGPNAITCNFLANTFCPVLEGEVIQYTLKMYIEPIFPVGTSVNIEFRVVDDSNAPVFCFRTGITIVPPVNSTLAIDV